MGVIMTKPAFTPGPWKVSGKVVKLGPDNYLTVIAPDRWVAHIMDGCQKSEEDACLIAAAPDMYEALRLAEEHFGGPLVNLDLTDKDYEVLKTIRAALTKVQP